MGELPEQLVQEDFPEATVIGTRAGKLHQSESDLDRIKAFLFQLIEAGKGPLILDLTGVAISSGFLGMLIALRKMLNISGKTFHLHPGQHGGFWLFTIVEDKAEALKAIRQGETDPLLLCGVNPELRCFFQSSYPA